MDKSKNQLSEAKELSFEEVKNDIIQRINEERAKHQLDPLTNEQLTRLKGGNGYPVGQEFTLTGKINLAVKVTNDKNVVTGTYIGIEYAPEKYLSLNSIMNLPTIRGYKLEGEYPNENNSYKGDTAQMVATEIIKDFDFAKVYQPKYRNVYEFAAYLLQNVEKWKGTKITYLGTACKPYTATKDGKDIVSNEDYSAGQRRVISTKLFGWNFTD